MDSPEITPRCAQQFAEDESVWAAYEWRREMRKLIGKMGPLAEFPSEAGEQADWRAAEQEIGRRVEAHGHWSDEAG